MFIELGLIDYVLLIVYFVFVLGIGFVLRRASAGQQGLLRVGPLAAGLDLRAGVHRREPGAQEVMGMAASGAKYGIMTSHFYWVGAIPAMVFVASS